MHPDNHDPPKRAHRYLTITEREQIAEQLWDEALMVTGKPILAYGAVGRCAKRFGVSLPVISKVWKQMKSDLEKGILSASPVKEPPCRDELRAQIAALPACPKRNMLEMAAELGVSNATLDRLLRSKGMEVHEKKVEKHTFNVDPTKIGSGHLDTWSSTLLPNPHNIQGRSQIL